MEKKVIIICLCILFFLPFEVLAYSGVTPSSYDRDFKPNFKESFAFRFLFPENSVAELSVEGVLAEYVRLDKKTLKGSGVVIVLLELPEEVDSYGVNRIIVRAKQFVESKEGFSLAFSVGGLIRLRVPYPGKYAELDFKTHNVNQGEPVNFDLTIYSRGKEDIYATAHIDIYDSDNVFTERLNLGTHLIESAKNEKLSTKLNTENYVAGDYNATVVVEYGGENPAVDSKIFRLGKLFVDVSNHTKEFERGKINKFEIEVESFWNSEIENLYAEVDILGYEESFKTPSANLEPWKKTTLSGFFDTSAIEESKFKANITLHYHGETTSKVVDLKFVKDTNYIFYAILSASGIIFLILLVLVIYFLIRRHKSRKK